MLLPALVLEPWEDISPSSGWLRAASQPGPWPPWPPGLQPGGHTQRLCLVFTANKSLEVSLNWSIKVLTRPTRTVRPKRPPVFQVRHHHLRDSQLLPPWPLWGWFISSRCCQSARYFTSRQQQDRLVVVLINVLMSLKQPASFIHFINYSCCKVLFKSDFKCLWLIFS